MATIAAATAARTALRARRGERVRCGYSSRDGKDVVGAGGDGAGGRADVDGGDRAEPGAEQQPAGVDPPRRMERVVRVHYGGSVLESSNGGSQFDGMSVKMIELLCRTKDILGWSDKVVSIQDRYDMGGEPISHKQMLELNGETKWEAYVEISVAGTVTHFTNLANRNEELEAQLQQLRSSFNILQAFATPFVAVLICIIAIAAWRFA
uniref:Uncharacterized protein n=1 Tax=Oryza barthii TaxID=65489 RepID=A0A0D3G9K8_9ORYZ